MSKETVKYIKGIGIGILCVLAGVLYWFYTAVSSTEPEVFVNESEEEMSEVLAKTEEEESEREMKICVHVGGAVRNPDKVYALWEGARVSDAIEMAGGCMEDAELSGINLARKLEDGQKIYIPRQGEDYEEKENYEESARNDLTDLNKADKIELDALPGIGPALAQRIIEYREEHGGFSEIEDLKKVKGIGDTLFEKLRDKITAG